MWEDYNSFIEIIHWYSIAVRLTSSPVLSHPVHKSVSQVITGGGGGGGCLNCRAYLLMKSIFNSNIVLLALVIIEWVSIQLLR